MKERPILFSGEMVRAILDGRKTQTRRVVTQRMNPHDFLGGIGDNKNDPYNYGFENPDCLGHFITLPEQRCPYGKIGDQIWVRETFHRPTDQVTIYRANWREDARARGFDNIPNTVNWKWTPSIHMPRWASRIQLEITGIRVERLQDISEEDALSEGVPRNEDYPIENGNCPACFGQGVHGALGPNWGVIEVDCRECDTAKKRFQHLWSSINGEKSWDKNPWVWVIEFERIKP